MTKRKRINWKGTEHAVFGLADPFSAHKLPLHVEVLRNCLRYKCEAGRFADVNEIVKQAALDVFAIWARTIGDRLTIILLDQKTIENKLKILYKKGLLVNKNKRNLVKLNEFKMEMGQFFDVCSYTCPSASCFQVHCKTKNFDGFHLACRCDVKVPKREIQFLLDQRCAQKMVIADIDRNVSIMWTRAAARNEAMEVAAEIEKVQAEVRQEQVQLDLSDESAYEVGDNNKSKTDEDYIQMNIPHNSFKTNLTKLSTLTLVCNKYGVSNYAGAAIASATLVDYSIINKADKSSYWTTETERQEEAMQRGKAGSRS